MGSFGMISIKINDINRSDHVTSNGPDKSFPRADLSVPLKRHKPGELILAQIIPKERSL